MAILSPTYPEKPLIDFEGLADNSFFVVTPLTGTKETRIGLVALLPLPERREIRYIPTWANETDEDYLALVSLKRGKRLVELVQYNGKDVEFRTNLSPNKLFTASWSTHCADLSFRAFPGERLSDMISSHPVQEPLIVNDSVVLSAVMASMPATPTASFEPGWRNGASRSRGVESG